MKRDVIVVTAAYGRDRINALGGQQAVIPIIAAAGAQGIEIRRELFSDKELLSLTGLGHTIADASLVAYYSVPEALFTDEGQLNPELDRHLEEAEQLQARCLKYALGNYPRGFGFTGLRNKLASHALQLVVENDQTACGKLSAMRAFLTEGGEALSGCGITFDMGNWLWVGDDPLAAARELSAAVSYIHVKAAVPQGEGWRAVALDEADSLWRETLNLLPPAVPRGIEFPLEGDDLVAVTRRYVDLLREE